jgi:Zn-dependent alcohol dehydrogenase
VANVGVHGTPATLHLEDLWIKGVTITTGLVDGYSTPTLLSLISSGQLEVGRFVTHRFAFGEFLDAYETFSNAQHTGALKIVVAHIGALTRRATQVLRGCARASSRRERNPDARQQASTSSGSPLSV